MNTKTSHLIDRLTPWADLIGRVGLATIFLLAGINKVQFYEGNAQFLASGGLHEGLLPLVILFELGGAILLVVGLFTRYIALLFAGFCAVTALLYHNHLDDPVQYLMFLKNLAIAGGFLVLTAHGAGRFSVDHQRNNG